MRTVSQRPIADVTTAARVAPHELLCSGSRLRCCHRDYTIRARRLRPRSRLPSAPDQAARREVADEAKFGGDTAGVRTARLRPFLFDSVAHVRFPPIVVIQRLGIGKEADSLLFGRSRAALNDRQGWKADIASVLMRSKGSLSKLIAVHKRRLNRFWCGHQIGIDPSSRHTTLCVRGVKFCSVFPQ